jgi:hypothetical protein
MALSAAAFGRIAHLTAANFCESKRHAHSAMRASKPVFF